MTRKATAKATATAAGSRGRGSRDPPLQERKAKAKAKPKGNGDGEERSFGRVLPQDDRVRRGELVKGKGRRRGKRCRSMLVASLRRYKGGGRQVGADDYLLPARRVRSVKGGLGGKAVTAHRIPRRTLCDRGKPANSAGGDGFRGLKTPEYGVVFGAGNATPFRARPCFGTAEAARFRECDV